MKLEVQVNKTNFYKEAKKGYWCLISTDAGTCKGEMAWIPQEDERLKLEGDWVTYQGQKQFSFKTAMPCIPDNPRARLHYCVELAKGVGPSMEEKIWQVKGEDFPQIEESEVPGLKGDVYREFIEATEQLRHSEDYIQVISYILDIGGTWNMAEAAYQQWGKETIGVIQNDVYQLSYLPNYGFNDADKFRGKFNIGDKDPRRVRAAVYYIINQAAADGHTVLTWETLKHEFQRFVGRYDELLAEQVAEMFKQAALIGWRDTRKITTAEAHETEKRIWEYAV